MFGLSLAQSGIRRRAHECSGIHSKAHVQHNQFAARQKSHSRANLMSSTCHSANRHREPSAHVFATIIETSRDRRFNGHACTLRNYPSLGDFGNMCMRIKSATTARPVSQSVTDKLSASTAEGIAARGSCATFVYSQPALGVTGTVGHAAARSAAATGSVVMESACAQPVHVRRAGAEECSRRVRVMGIQSM
jgi:hypothetical protein